MSFYTNKKPNLIEKHIINKLLDRKKPKIIKKNL